MIFPGAKKCHVFTIWSGYMISLQNGTDNIEEKANDSVFDTCAKHGRRRLEQQASELEQQSAAPRGLQDQVETMGNLVEHRAMGSKISSEKMFRASILLNRPPVKTLRRCWGLSPGTTVKTSSKASEESKYRGAAVP
jgi:hypothetical protein